jgi:hypothetical protein
MLSIEYHIYHLYANTHVVREKFQRMYHPHFSSEHRVGHLSMLPSPMLRLYWQLH